MELDSCSTDELPVAGDASQRLTPSVERGAMVPSNMINVSHATQRAVIHANLFEARVPLWDERERESTAVGMGLICGCYQPLCVSFISSTLPISEPRKQPWPSHHLRRQNAKGQFIRAKLSHDARGLRNAAL